MLFFPTFFMGNAQVIFVCKLENNGIYSSPMSVSETSDVSMEIPYVMPTDLDDAIHVAEQSIGELVPGHDFTVDQPLSDYN